MNICLIGEFPLPGKSPSTGPETVLHNLITMINNIDKTINIKVVSIQNYIERPIVNNYSQNTCIYYIPKLKFLSRSLGDPIIVKRFLKKHSFDIIHAHYPIALLKVMDLETPKILTLHGIFHIEKKFVSSPFVRIFYYDYNIYMLKKILPKLDGFVAISPYVIDILNEKKLYDKIKCVYQINNPVDRSFFVTNSETKKDNLIFFPGGISKLKNQITAVRAIKHIYNEIKDLELIFAGSYEEKYFKDLLNEIDKYDLADVVKYQGILPKEAVLEFYNKSSIVYLLSNHEVQPMVVIEAMATGTPVIASNLRSISHIIDNGVTGYLVNPDDPQEIAYCTEMLLSDRKRRLEIGKNAKKVAQDNYCAEAIAIQTLEMYKTILSSKS